MKFITFETKDGLTQWGMVQQDGLIQCLGKQQPYSSLLSLIEGGPQALSEIQSGLANKDLPLYNLSEVKIKAPYYPRKNIVCVGKNYKEHALEMSDQDYQAIPEFPVLFTKPYSSIIEHKGSVHSYPEITQELDYEGELAIIIGKKGINISKEEAHEYIFGYSIINDISARDLQKQHLQFFKGKSLDTFAPFGPVIVHRSAVPNPQDLQIKTFVNDEERQNASTKDMLFSIAEIIEVISRGMTVEPGDIIATGTPSGVGKGFKPPKFLKAGDTVRIEIDGIGRLENKVI
jgi:2-keto-4-pentenoate hydratase/2-oxohepta-3-ene-1,7-dioic acid hydratase in catechol pathway